MGLINEKQYKSDFEVDNENSTTNLKSKVAANKAENALQMALDIRKFEIDLYWKRAAYFWTLIAAAFAGYFALLETSGNNFPAFLISCIGFVFTFAWHLVNRGSKFWQENWENHVDMLENQIVGPLYKTILRRPNYAESCKAKKNELNKEAKKPDKTTLSKKIYSYLFRMFDSFITGPAQISPSKILQWVSVFTLLIWFILACNALEMTFFECSTKCWNIAVIALSSVLCLLMLLFGRTHNGGYGHVAEQRSTVIIDPK